MTLVWSLYQMAIPQCKTHGIHNLKLTLRQYPCIHRYKPITVYQTFVQVRFPRLELKKIPPPHPSTSDQTFHFICRLHNVLDILKFPLVIYPLKLQQFLLSIHDNFFFNILHFLCPGFLTFEMLTPQNQ